MTFQEGDEVRIKEGVTLSVGEGNIGAGFDGYVFEVRSDGLVGVEFEHSYFGAYEAYMQPKDIGLIEDVCPECGADMIHDHQTFRDEYVVTSYCPKCLEDEKAYVDSLTEEERKEYFEYR